MYHAMLESPPPMASINIASWYDGTKDEMSEANKVKSAILRALHD
jgi:hypothetical protein